MTSTKTYRPTLLPGWPRRPSGEAGCRRLWAQSVPRWVPGAARAWTCARQVAAGPRAGLGAGRGACFECASPSLPNRCVQHAVWLEGCGESEDEEPELPAQHGSGAGLASQPAGCCRHVSWLGLTALAGAGLQLRGQACIAGGHRAQAVVGVIVLLDALLRCCSGGATSMRSIKTRRMRRPRSEAARKRRRAADFCWPPLLCW